MVDEKVAERMNNLASIKPEERTEENIEELLELFEFVENDELPSYLPYLFQFLEDDGDMGGIYETLLSTIKDSPTQYYIPCLLRNLRELYSRASSQCKSLFWTIFNTAEDFEFLKQNIHLADKETLLKVLKDIEDDEPLPEHVVAIQELRKLLNSDDLIYADK